MDIGHRIQHIKRGTEYIVIGKSTLNISPDLLTDETVITPQNNSELVQAMSATPHEDIGVQCGSDIDEHTVWVLYEALHRDPDADYPAFWLRPYHEFEGRFVML